MRLAWLMVLLCSPAHAIVPLSPASTQAVDANFIQMAQELSRLDLTDGGVVNGTTTYKGPQVQNASSTFNGLAIFNGGIRGNTANSTMTTITPATSFTSNILGPCVVSTLTLTTYGSPVMVWYSGGVVASNDIEIKASAIVDGAHMTGLDSDFGAVVSLVYGSHSANLSFQRLVTLSAGTHTICLSGAVSGNTGYFGYTTGGYANRPQFGAIEMR